MGTKAKSIWTFIAAGALLLAFAGCTAASGNNATPPTNDVGPLAIQGVQDDRLTAANNDFAFRMLQELRAHEPGENVFFSPLSISVALAMTWNGADGETREDMAETLGFGDMEMEEVNAAFRHLLDALNNPSDGSDAEMALRVVNSLWPREDVTVHEDYRSRVLGAFDAEVFPLDMGDPESVDILNAWVEEQTEGKIDEITDSLDANIVMILLNAIYFLGSWEQPFDPDNTSAAPFRLADGTEREVSMMSQSPRMDHLDGDGFQALRMPYDGGNVSMYVFLPDDDSSLDAFMDGLNPNAWEEWMDGFQDAQGTLALPKFEMEYEVQLEEILPGMGMEIAFGPGADFSAMTPNNPWIDEVKHKAIVEVHEEGTEAAAVTMVVMVESAPMGSFDFTVDRPFFFALQDDDTGTLLFMGAVHDIGE
ncbi:MAG: serpin family protein [Dehalococcoidia bacterium]